MKKRDAFARKKMYRLIARYRKDHPQVKRLVNQKLKDEITETELFVGMALYMAECAEQVTEHWLTAKATAELNMYDITIQ